MFQTIIIIIIIIIDNNNHQVTFKSFIFFCIQAFSLNITWNGNRSIWRIKSGKISYINDDDVCVCVCLFRNFFFIPDEIDLNCYCFCFLFCFYCNTFLVVVYFCFQFSIVVFFLLFQFSQQCNNLPEWNWIEKKQNKTNRKRDSYSQ